MDKINLLAKLHNLCLQINEQQSDKDELMGKLNDQLELIQKLRKELSDQEFQMLNYQKKLKNLEQKVNYEKVKKSNKTESFEPELKSSSRQRDTLFTRKSESNIQGGLIVLNLEPENNENYPKAPLASYSSLNVESVDNDQCMKLQPSKYPNQKLQNKGVPIQYLTYLEQIQPQTSICWDALKVGTGITLEQNNTKIFLKEQSYVFRSAVSNIGFTSGINYWEIIADLRAKNELKIGVSLSKEFDMNSTFCDHSFGYAFNPVNSTQCDNPFRIFNFGIDFLIYRPWQKMLLQHWRKSVHHELRENDNYRMLSEHAKRNSEFCHEWEVLACGLPDKKLKEGPIYPAVSFSNCARACKIRAGLSVPDYFIQWEDNPTIITINLIEACYHFHGYCIQEMIYSLLSMALIWIFSMDLI